MKQDHPFDLTNVANRAVYDYIKNLSTHSDLAEPMIEAAKPLGDVQIFAAEEPHGCGFVALSTKGIIFGIALGMDTISFRLDDRMKERAIISGAKEYSKCGPEWVAFEPFRCDWPKVDFEFWARKAYAYVREGTP